MKTVLITGASRGIGRDIARRLAREDYRVIINYNKSEKEAKELEKEILSILSVMDKRLQNVAIYQEEDFPGEQFFSIRNFSASLEANSRMLHLFARLLETQGDIKKLTKEEKNYCTS